MRSSSASRSRRGLAVVVTAVGLAVAVDLAAADALAGSPVGPAVPEAATAGEGRGGAGGAGEGEEEGEVAGEEAGEEAAATEEKTEKKTEKKTRGVASLGIVGDGASAPAAGGSSRAVAPPEEAISARLSPRLGLGGELRVAAAIHQPAVAVTLRGDYAWPRAAVGLGLEANPYLGVGRRDLHPGALHVAAFADHRLTIGRVTLRQRLGLGPAILLAELDGRARGAVGLFVEAAPLGIEIQTAVRRLAVVLEAFSLALSAPALGVGEGGAPPILRQQYRATLGLRF